MDITIYGPLLGLLLLLFLGSGIWVALSLLGIAAIGMLMFSNAPVEAVMPSTVWSALSTWTLTALPLFIWMGEILFRTRLASDLFHGLSPWLGRLPGRLLHVNVLGCGIFSAVSGSSAATAATVGQMSIPELKKRGYDEPISLGSLAASGTLGLLIPPSIILIVYGVSVNLSIGKLFLAGVFPGLLIIALFSSYIIVWAMLNANKMPPAEARLGWGESLKRLRLLLPIVLLIIGVIGSIYAGFATATEAATIGVVGSMLIAYFSGGLTWKSFLESVKGAMHTSCMIALIIAGAAFLTVSMGFSGIPRALAEWIATMELSPYALLFALTLLYLVLGCFLDGISLVLLSTAVVIPMVEAAGIDLIWFGIFLVLLVEIAQLTPPVGMNLFVVQGITGRDIVYLTKAVAPFFVLLIFAIVLLTIFPEIAIWLPETMKTAR
ncbi:TRAP transporter large permease subunit [Candidimonas sp. SYP-B2681]|uniref:TRAP transporter large permease n=1 Tax=Candidimonas sp. SYP-B2681 TaxID=2497686 RepID=UPI000F86BCF7|nr:TRAP transporter large permease subunit [Candidimonas sp. SYP-B2681]RTZ48061.1 TRAP transporter large permease subunit [Candidimonas sp. SYP-B2681]